MRRKLTTKRKRRLLSRAHREAELIQAIFSEPITPENENAREVLLGCLLELEDIVAIDLLEDPTLVRNLYPLLVRGIITYLEKPDSEDEVAQRMVDRAGRVRQVLRRIAAGHTICDPVIEEMGWPTNFK